MAAFAVAGVSAGCERAPPTSAARRPASTAAPVARATTEPSSGPRAFVTFTDVAADSGLAAHVLHAGRKDAQNWVLETIGGGVVVLDHDGDGDMDALLVDGDGLDARGELLHEPDARTRLWRNDGGLRFTDVTAAAGIDVRGYGLGGAAADYDGDGHVDVAIVGYRFLRLLRNRGDGTFEDRTRAAGLPAETLDTSSSCAWGDLDGDGLADLFVTNYADQYAEVEATRRENLAPRRCGKKGFTVYCGPQGLAPGRNRLFLQRPDHTFEDRTATQLVGGASYSFQAILSDLDGDGDLDVYVPNDGDLNFLYVNDGRGVLTDAAVVSGVAGDRNCRAQASMGVDVADYDRDGCLDLLVTNFSDDHNTLYRNTTRRTHRMSFEDVSIVSRVGAAPRDRLCWGTGLVDFENDGVLDAFVACGHVYPECESYSGGTTNHLQRPLLLQGCGPPHFVFEDVTDRGGAPFRERRLWRGAGFADFDDDGDWDVLTTAMRDPPALLRNDGGSRLNWLRLDLRGRPPLTSAPGVRATVQLPDGTRLTDELHLGSSYGGSSDPRLLFGVGAVERIPRVEIRWPGGATSVLADVEARTTVVVRQP